MKRKAFVPPSVLERQEASAASQPTASATAALAVFDCVFTQKRRSTDGVLVVRGMQARVLNLQLREAAAGALPERTAAKLHAAHSAAMAAVAAREPLGPLWHDCEAPEDLAVGAVHVAIEDDRAAAIGAEE
jgi:hypothetical protein